MNVTRAVILDLWPGYLAGEASPDSKALIEEFLAADPAFARELQQPLSLPAIAPIPADKDVRLFEQVRRRLWGYPMLLQMALLFSALAFGRIVSDTSWDVSPRRFIIVSTIAACFWVAYFVTLWRMRARIVILPKRTR